MKACEILYPAAVFVCCSQRGENEFDLAGCWCCSLTAVRPARLSCAQLMYTQLLTLSRALSRSLETLHIRPLTLSPLFISSEAHYPPVIPRFGGIHHLNLPRKICHNVNNSLDFHAFDNSQVHKKVSFLCFYVNENNVLNLVFTNDTGLFLASSSSSRGMGNGKRCFLRREKTALSRSSRSSGNPRRAVGRCCSLSHRKKRKTGS